MTPALLERIVASRLSIRQLAQTLREEGTPVSRRAIASVLRDHRPARKRRYSDDVVRRIHASIESDAGIAQRLTDEGITINREMVRQIRAGLVYADLKPRTPTVHTGRSCTQCIHWRGAEAASPCDLDHRDPLEEGPLFGKICNTYRKAPE